jgi:2'-5' RNA ligase
MRYAVYFCPAAGSELDVFGREWLSTRSIPGIDAARMHALLADVRRYGWHATLGAPFTLADGVSYMDLREHVLEIARASTAFALPLKLDRLSGFLALRPAADETAINTLAERCVRYLNLLRAPLSEAAWLRRVDSLDEVERRLFRQFGYPYVLERYRFHMTLTAPATQQEEQVLSTWLSLKAATLPPAQIDALTLCRESAPGGDFEELERIALNKGPVA